MIYNIAHSYVTLLSICPLFSDILIRKYKWMMVMFNIVLCFFEYLLLIRDNTKFQLGMIS